MDALYLIAKIADTRVALRSRAINSVVAIDARVEVLGAPPYVAGLFALRSRIFTLIDPHVFVGRPSMSAVEGQRAILIDVAGHGYALIADEIEDVCFIEAPETRVLGKLTPGWARIAQGMIEHDGGSLLVIDPSHFITLSDLKAA